MNMNAILLWERRWRLLFVLEVAGRYSNAVVMDAILLKWIDPEVVPEIYSWQNNSILTHHHSVAHLTKGKQNKTKSSYNAIVILEVYEVTTKLLSQDLFCPFWNTISRKQQLIYENTHTENPSQSPSGWLSLHRFTKAYYIAIGLMVLGFQRRFSWTIATPLLAFNPFFTMAMTCHYCEQ